MYLVFILFLSYNLYVGNVANGTFSKGIKKMKLDQCVCFTKQTKNSFVGGLFTNPTVGFAVDYNSEKKVYELSYANNMDVILKQPGNLPVLVELSYQDILTTGDITPIVEEVMFFSGLSGHTVRYAFNNPFDSTTIRYREFIVVYKFFSAEDVSLDPFGVVECKAFSSELIGDFSGETIRVSLHNKPFQTDTFVIHLT